MSKANVAAVYPVAPGPGPMAHRRTVGEDMTTTVTTLGVDTTIGQTLGIFGECSFRHLLVASADGRLEGVLSDRDVLRVLGRGADPTTTTVGTVMRREPIVVAPDTPVTSAIELMCFHRINCLPVVDERRHLKGIVTTTDLLSTLYNLLGDLEGWG